MNAVNLIPADARKRRNNVSASPLTLGLIGGLVAILAAAVLYVSAANDVTARKSELAKVTASVSSWQAAANSFASLEATAQQRSAQLASVRALADGRFPWSRLLSQIGGLMPAKAALSSLQASAPSTSSSTSATGAATTTAGSTAAGSTASGPVISLSGCAQDDSTVADTMEQLRRVSGVSDVSLTTASSGSSGTTGAPAASSSSPSGSGGCSFPVQFQMSLTLSPSATGSSSAGMSTTSAGATPAATTATTPQAGAALQ
jgi:Tfp pilus assembly protein PilN